MSSTNTIIGNSTDPSAPVMTMADPASGCLNSPPPVKEHQWLERFVGEWDADIEAFMEPGQPPMKTTGVERARMLGGFWLVSEGRNTVFPFSFIFTLGFDPGKSKYVATWVDTMSSHLWKYEGEVDPTGEILTLETQGPAPMVPGRHVKFRETTQFKGPDQRLFTSSILGDDGKWSTLLIVNCRRRK